MDKAKLEKLSVYAIGILYGLSFWSWPTHAPDLGWHLLGGFLTLENWAVPRDDLINSFNHSWHDYHWLAQVLMYKIYDIGSYPALRIALGLLMGYCAKVVLDCIYLVLKNSATLILVLISFFITFSYLAQVTSVRPQMLALLLLFLSLRRLLQQPRIWELAYLFVLTVISVNIHVYWVFIPFLWLLYRCLSKNTSLLYPWSVFFLLLCSGLISPYGLLGASDFALLNYALLWDYLVMPNTLRSYINEMKSVFSVTGIVPVIVLFMIFFSSKAFNFKRSLVRFSWHASFLTALILCVRSLKFLGVFSVLGLPLTAYSLRRCLGQVWKYLDSKVIIKQFTVLGLCLLVILRTWNNFPLWDDKSGYRTEFLPIEACKKISKLNLTPSHQRGHLRVLTHFNYGGWCRWILHQEQPAVDYRVTTDGRTQWVPPDHYQKSFELFNARGLWADTLAAWNPDVAVVYKDMALAQFMARSPGEWKLAHEDQNYAVFVPVIK